MNDSAVAEAAANIAGTSHDFGFSCGLDAGLNLGATLALEWVLSECALSPDQERRVRDRIAQVEEASP